MATYTGQLDVEPDEFSLNVQTMIYDGREKPISFDWYGRDYDLGTTYKLHGAAGRQEGGCYEAHAIEYHPEAPTTKLQFISRMFKWAAIICMLRASGSKKATREPTAYRARSRRLNWLAEFYPILRRSYLTSHGHFVYHALTTSEG